MKSRTVAVLGVLVSLATAVGAQETPAADPSAAALALDSVVELAVAASATVLALRDSLAQKLTDAGIGRYFQGVGMSLGGGIGGDIDDPLSYSGSTAVSANIPLLPQLSLNGSFTAAYAEGGETALGGSVGLSFSPLADATARAGDLLDIERAGIYLESAIRGASSGAISRLLSAVMADGQSALAEMKHSVAEEVMQATAVLFEKEQATEASYNAARDALRARSHELRLSRIATERALELLAQTVALSADRINLPQFEDLQLEGFAEQAAVLVGSADAELLAEDAPGVLLARIDVREAELDLSSARAFSPSLTVTASAGLPDLDYFVGAQFGFSVSDFDLTARDGARKDLSQARVVQEHAARMVQFDVREALLELEIAVEDLKAAEGALATAELNLAETRYFAEQGEATGLHLAQSELAVRVAEYGAAGAEVSIALKWFAIEFAQY